MGYLLSATTRPPAVTIALQTLDLLLPLLDRKAVGEVNETTLESQTFAVQQGEEHRGHEPAQHQHTGNERS